MLSAWPPCPSPPLPHSVPITYLNYIYLQFDVPVFSSWFLPAYNAYLFDDDSHPYKSYGERPVVENFIAIGAPFKGSLPASILDAIINALIGALGEAVSLLGHGAVPG